MKTDNMRHWVILHMISCRLFYQPPKDWKIIMRTDENATMSDFAHDFVSFISPAPVLTSLLNFEKFYMFVK